MTRGSAADRDATRLVVYGDYVCPFSYVAQAQLARLRAELGVAPEFRAFELHPAPEPLRRMDDPEIVRHWRGTIEPLAQSLGVRIRYPTVEPRTRKAHELAAHAREQDRFEEIHAALFRAHFVDGRDIGRIDVLVGLAEAAGLDPTGTKVALDIDQYTERVRSDQAEAAAYGITGVPAFRRGGEVLIGLHSHETLRALVRGGSDEGKGTGR